MLAALLIAVASGLRASTSHVSMRARSSSNPKFFNVYLRNDNCTQKDYAARVLMMVVPCEKEKATAIIREANKDRYLNRALIGTWEEPVAEHIYTGIQSAGLTAVMKPAASVDDENEIEDEDEDLRPRYLDGTLIENEDLPRYYQ